jgi:predicted phage-related endonuclease
MKIGVFMEPYVAKYAAQKHGLKIRANTRTIEHRKVNLCATPDYLVLNQPMLLEVKVSSIFYGWSEDDLHPWYEYQARAQMACTNREVCIIVALVGSAFFSVPVVRDRDKEEALLQTVDDFFTNHILTGVRPVEPEQSGLWATVTQKGK